MSLFGELKRRNVFRVAAAYLVTAWLLIEVSATLEETLRLPEWSDSLLAMFLILGFPVALFVSWAYEVTPEGIKKESELSPDRPSRPETGRKLDRIIMVMMAIALGYFAVDKFLLTGTEPTSGTVRQAADASALTPSMAAAPEPTESAAASDLSIAVLPFMNMSSDPEQEYFSDGLTEELLNLLAKIPELKVAARTSSFYYKDRMHDIPFKDIGRQLEVAHLLEGSVRKGGDKIRITAQLIKAEDGFHLWSETWDRTLDDVFAIQDEIAAAVAEQLKITLLGETPHADVIDSESWELTLQARYFFNRRRDGDLERAFELYRQAVEIDPNNAAAWAEITPLYSWIFNPPDRENAYKAAQRALELEPENPVAHARIVPLVWRREGREQTNFHMMKSLDYGRRHPTVLGIWTGWSSLFGRYDLEVAFYEKALTIDPLHPVNLSNLADLYNWEGRLADALDLLQRIEDFDLDEAESITISRAENRLLDGDPEGALALLATLPPQAEEIGAMQGTPFIRDLIRILAQDQTGQLQDRAGALARYTDRYGNDPLGIASLQASLGDPDAAFDTLSRLYGTSGEVWGANLNSPYLEPLHDDPRWTALTDRIPDVPEDMEALINEVLSE